MAKNPQLHPQLQNAHLKKFIKNIFHSGQLPAATTVGGNRSDNGIETARRAGLVSEHESARTQGTISLRLALCRRQKAGTRNGTRTERERQSYRSHIANAAAETDAKERGRGTRFVRHAN